ncbi:MAG: methyltransferase domain-containing protein [Proteobacteria bacterium]|nr:methyltransferase domain-containing protein [Pseudomonadota bacterium]
MNNKSVKYSFDRAANYYSKNAFSQRIIAQELFDFFDKNHSFKRIIEFGCGTGFFTNLLLKQYPDSVIEAIDVSSEMINHISSESENLTVHVADAREYQSKAGSFDLLVCCSSLQWMEPIDKTLDNWRNQANPAAKYLFSIMIKGTLEEIRSERERLFPEAAKPLTLYDESEIFNILEKSKLKIIKSKINEYKESYNSSADVINHIRNIGVTASSDTNNKNLSKDDILTLTRALDSKYKNSNIPLIYRVIFIEAINNTY